LRTNNSLQGVRAAFFALDEKLAIDINVLDISEISIIADYFIIASGSNPNQMKAMADAVEEALYKAGFKLSHSEGFQTKTWILLDFGDIVIHLFNKEERDFYNIERIWGDARFLSREELESV